VKKVATCSKNLDFGGICFKFRKKLTVSPKRIHSDYFSARSGRIRAVMFHLKSFGRISSANTLAKFVQIDRNSPEIFEDESQLCEFSRFARKNIYCVFPISNFLYINFMSNQPLYEWYKFLLDEYRLSGSKSAAVHGFRSHQMSIICG
jgi:hypothetical protein